MTDTAASRLGDTPAGDLSALRKGNRMRVLAALRDYGPQSQKDLAARVKLSQASISNMVAELLELDQVTLTERVDRRRYKIVSLSGRLGLVLGIGVDHQKIDVVLGNLACEIYQSRSMSTSPELTPIEMLKSAVTLAEECIAGAGRKPADVVAVGLSLPSPIAGPATAVEPAFPQWWSVHPVQWLTARLGARVVLDNAAYAATMAEWRWGAGRGCSDFLNVTVADGIGAGFVLANRIYHGGLGGGGEIGHVVVEPGGGQRCRCGNSGCLETFASLPAMLRTAQEAGARVTTHEEFLDAAVAGDAVCLDIVTRESHRIGSVLGSVASLLSPTRIIIGGTLARASSVALPALRRGFADAVIPTMPVQPAVIEAELNEASIAVGAMAIATASLPDEDLLQLSQRGG
ncbi:ROK family transcriptional regulator [Rugosimonospora africana]|uniref:Transcriptional regulator n=1 Tax=Rugosimonospora africana TaxID=556532 RepID=A0A8J3QQU8_9ACTN|nr:ROK family transcriptional regulator [Rugosimonospora africana]GIH14866.1 transcriptional regulator [Rugosimonospora africana]